MLEPFLERAFVDERVAPYGTTASTRPRFAGASSSNRRSDVWRACRGGESASSSAAVPTGIIEGLRAARLRLEIVDIGPLFRPLRRAKHADEIDLLRRSMRAGEAGLAAALEKVRPGMTELDAYLIVQNAAMTELGEQVIVYGDIASGPRCAREKGGSPTSREIEPGDLLLIDFSVIVSGYRGDFTNTFAVGGGPTSGQRELFEACVGAPARARRRSNPARPPATSTPPCAATLNRWGSTNISRHIRDMGSASGTPSLPILFPKAATLSRPGTWSPSSPVCMSRRRAACATSGIT